MSEITHHAVLGGYAHTLRNRVAAAKDFDRLNAADHVLMLSRLADTAERFGEILEAEEAILLETFTATRGEAAANELTAPLRKAQRQVKEIEGLLGAARGRLRGHVYRLQAHAGALSEPTKRNLDARPHRGPLIAAGFLHRAAHDLREQMNAAEGMTPYDHNAVLQDMIQALLEFGRACGQLHEPLLLAVLVVADKPMLTDKSRIAAPVEEVPRLAEQARRKLDDAVGALLGDSRARR